MKGLRDFIYASYMMVKTSYEMNPVKTTLLGLAGIVFLLSILGVI